MSPRHVKRAALTIRWIWKHPGNQGARFRALGRFAYWGARRRIKRKPLVFTAFDGMSMHLYPDSMSARRVYYTKIPDYEEMLFLCAVLRPGDTFLDVGANVGIYTLLAASILGRDAHVLAIEPNRKARSKLLEHLTANRLQNVRVYAVAIGCREGWARMSSDLGPMNHVCDSLTQEPRPQGPDWLRMMTLDSICSDVNPFIGKMDIEGYELEALRGAQQLINRRRPAAWVLEVNRCARRYDWDESTLEEWIHDNGGILSSYDPLRRRLVPLTTGQLRVQENVIAVFDEDAIRRRLSTGPEGAQSGLSDDAPR
jgi:FkbM family methyltransferase